MTGEADRCTLIRVGHLINSTQAAQNRYLPHTYTAYTTSVVPRPWHSRNKNAMSPYMVGIASNWMHILTKCPLKYYERRPFLCCVWFPINFNEYPTYLHNICWSICRPLYHTSTAREISVTHGGRPWSHYGIAHNSQWWSRKADSLVPSLFHLVQREVKTAEAGYQPVATDFNIHTDIDFSIAGSHAVELV